MVICRGLDACGQDKPETEFYLRRDTGKRHITCDDCRKAYNRKKNEETRIRLGKPKRQPPPNPVGRTKVCSTCDDTKDLSEFPFRADRNNTYENQCKACKNAAVAQWKSDIDHGRRDLRVDPEITEEGKLCRICDEMKPLEEYKIRSDTKHGYRTECRSCGRELHNQWQRRRVKIDDDFAIRRKVRDDCRLRLLRDVNEDSSFRIIVGISVDWVRSFFEYKFSLDPELTWRNHGTARFGGLWTVDHVIPLSRFDLTQPEEFAIAFNWKNTQPLRDNMEKGNKFRPEEYEAHIVAVKQFIQDNDLPIAEYQGLTEMADWLRDNLRYGNNLTDEDVPSTSKMDDPQPSP